MKPAGFMAVYGEGTAQPRPGGFVLRLRDGSAIFVAAPVPVGGAVAVYGLLRVRFARGRPYYHIRALRVLDPEGRPIWEDRHAPEPQPDTEAAYAQ